MILFRNNANDCYLNSVFQVLLNNEQMKNYFKTMKIENNINKVFYTLLNTPENEYVNPNSLKMVLADIDNESKELFYNNDQQDSHEALMKILDILHENNIVDKKSFIDKYFTGKYKTFVKCLNCDYLSVVKNNFRDIDFYPKHINIKECISRSADQEHISGVCEKCSKNTLFKKTVIYKYPNVLIICVKRFETDSIGQTRKLNDKFTIDHELCLEQNNYCLTSIIHHHGRNPNSGHYTVDVSINGKWYKINDDCMFEIETANIGSESIYILIYCKI